MQLLSAIFRTLRPRQWVKNAFVLAPLVFSKHLFDSAYSLRAVLAAAAFCAVSGAVYAFNDVRDVDQDRLHPTKRKRPIAAGELGERGALVLSVVLAVTAVAGSYALSWKLAVVVGAYLINNLIYSLAGKHVAFVDVLMLALGFVLRVIAGGVAIGVPLSEWLIACTALLSAMLGFGKRAHELACMSTGDSQAGITRQSLSGYRMRHLRLAMWSLSLATSVAYTLYTQDAHTIESFGTRALIWTVPFCVIGIVRFSQLVLRKESGESPTDAMLHDWPFLANIAAWGAAVLTIIYAGR